MENEADAMRVVLALAAAARGGGISGLFAGDPERVGRYSVSAAGIRADLSKTTLSAEADRALAALAAARKLTAFRDGLFAGAPVNPTEGRAAEHAQMRAVGGTSAAARMAAAERARAREYVEAVHREGRFTHLLNIGIGGSDLGPKLVVSALTTAVPGKLAARFLSNVDGHAVAGALMGLDPARTLVVVCSKTFTTAETLTNARAVRDWLGAHAGANMAAVTANAAEAGAFGIPHERVFSFPDTVGGRYSLWSMCGLSIPLACGWAAYEALLRGAAAMDEHARATPVTESLPGRLALLGLWHHAAIGYRARAVLPYDQRLALLPAFLQQLEMESNGKGVGLDGAPLPYPTAPATFGVPGTDCQHSFMQAIHQGNVIPAEFVVVRTPDHAYADAHRMLLANAIAQAEALLGGKTAAEAEAEMRAGGAGAAEARRLAPHRAFSGGRPSTTITVERLSAEGLGALLAMYEHKTAFEGTLMGINPFDQWGVELGKILAKSVLAELAPGAKAQAQAGAHDASTAALIADLRG